jgi:hypothetical protein
MPGCVNTFPVGAVSKQTEWRRVDCDSLPGLLFASKSRPLAKLRRPYIHVRNECV